MDSGNRCTRIQISEKWLIEKYTCLENGFKKLPRNPETVVFSSCKNIFVLNYLSVTKIIHLLRRKHSSVKCFKLLARLV